MADRTRAGGVRPHWLVIECNDGQESGYAGISPFTLWKNILRVEGEKGPL